MRHRRDTERGEHASAGRRIVEQRSEQHVAERTSPDPVDSRPRDVARYDAALDATCAAAHGPPHGAPHGACREPSCRRYTARAPAVVFRGRAGRGTGQAVRDPGGRLDRGNAGG
jgi:hypothetical protein